MEGQESVTKARLRRGFRLAAAAMLAFGVCGLQAMAQEPAADDLDLIQLRPNFYVIAGAGGNIVVQVGPIGVILVDSGSTQM